MMQKKIAKIKSVELGFEDHGILTFWLHVDYGGSCQGIGGRLLSGHSLKHEPPPEAGPFVGDLIIRILRACGARTWEELPGRTIYALFADGAGFHDQPVGIENLPTEDGEQFLFSDVLCAW